MNKITTPRLLLRNITLDDAQDMYECSRGENVGINAGWEPHKSIEETRGFIKAIFADEPYSFGIILNETGRLIGSVGLIADGKREYDGARMLGYSLDERYWNRGIMTEAAQAVIKFGFEQDGIEIISAYCYPYNKASQRVIEKCGFMYEGTLKKAELRYDGALLDNYCYSITKEEYRKGCL